MAVARRLPKVKPKGAAKRPPPKREPSLREREEAREAAYWQAWNEHQRTPSKESLFALEKARAARGGHVRQETKDDREQYLLHLLLVHGERGVSIFADELGITARAAREWRAKALKSRRPNVEAMRDYVVHRLDGFASMAIQAGEFGEAARAMSQAAKFAGVSEKIEVDHNVSGSLSLDTSAALSPLEALDASLFLAGLLGDALPNVRDVQEMNENKPRYLGAIAAAKAAFRAAVRAPQLPERKLP